MRAPLVHRRGVIVAAVALSACASIPPEPAAPVAQQAGVGLSVQIRPPLGAAYNADKVYFVRTDAQGEPDFGTLYASNFHREERVYLLNMPPGHYAAVAAMFSVRVLGSASDYIAYLPRPLIAQSRIEASVGRVVFSGRFVVDAGIGVCPDQADPWQLRIAEAVAPGVPKCGLLRIVLHEIGSKPVVVVGGSAFALGPSTYHYRGIAREAQQGSQARSTFIEAAQQDLRDSGWQLDAPDAVAPGVRTQPGG